MTFFFFKQKSEWHLNEKHLCSCANYGASISEQLAGIKHRKALGGFNVLAGACAEALIMRPTDRDTGSLSDRAQGDPAVTVYQWVHHPENHLLTLPSPLPGKALGAGRPGPALQAGGQ